MSDYDTDFYAWTQAQAQAIRAGAWEHLDLTHLAEEIEDVGKSERRALVSHLRVLITHLIKWKIQPERRAASWVHSMGNAQAEVQTILDQSPSLRPELPTVIAQAYAQAHRLAARETGLPASSISPTCPWSPTELLDPTFLDDTVS